MQLFIKTCIFTLGFLLSSTVIFAEKADEQNNSSRQTLEDYSQAIRLDPDNAELYRNRGVAYKKLGQFYYALRDFSWAIQLDPNDAVSYNNRGHTYSKLGQFVHAIEDYDRALRLDPHNVRAFINCK
jgi:Flp pilus assembly protein TadD